MEGKNFYVYELFEIYGKLLTQKQQDAIENYYGLDLSLSEIAELNGVSRQAIKCTLDVTEKQLFSYEEKLNLFKKIEDIKNLKVEESEKKVINRVLSIMEDR